MAVHVDQIMIFFYWYNQALKHQIKLIQSKKAREAFKIFPRF